MIEIKKVKITSSETPILADIYFQKKNNKKLIDAFGDRVESCREVSTAAEAVQLAYQLGTPGHTALLSPACASFDLFGSYEERGREFKAAVRNL